MGEWRKSKVLPGFLLLLCLGFLVYGIAGAGPPLRADWPVQRDKMVRTQIEKRGVVNRRVLAAMRKVERHLYIPMRYRGRAYDDHPLPIGHDQTISQPYIVAAMTELIDPKPDQTVLEIGTGSGYQAAVLAELVKKVYTIEIIPDLAQRARSTLKQQGYKNVEVIVGDGYRGLPKIAPFDAIIVTAAPSKVPQPLLDQLAVGGRLVIPEGVRDQELMVYERTREGIRSRRVFGVRFVPMTGEAERSRERAAP